jgi:hypothetical protein
MPCLCLPFSSPVVLFSHPPPFSSPVYSERSSACFGSATSSSSPAPSAPPLRRLARQPPSLDPSSPKPSPLLPPDVKPPPDPELLLPDREPPPPDPELPPPDLEPSPPGLLLPAAVASLSSSSWRRHRRLTTNVKATGRLISADRLTT